MRRTFPKEVRLRTRSDFRHFLKAQVRLVGKAIIVEVNKQELCLTRLGVTVSKKYGKSHLRNRFKRIVREGFRLARANLPLGLDLNIKPRNGAYQATSKEIEAELVSLLSHAHSATTRPIVPQSGAAPSGSSHQRTPPHSGWSRQWKNPSADDANGPFDSHTQCPPSTNPRPDIHE